MKPITVVIVFLALTLSSALASIGSYKNTESRIINDLNQALALTLQEKQDASITPDTLRVYREFLHIDALKSRAYLAYCLRNERSKITCSDTMVGHKNAHFIGIRGYANCSMATIFSLSDQRLPFSLSLLAMTWAVFAFCYLRRSHPQLMMRLVSYGGLSYSEDSDEFYNTRHQPLHLTPMQHQLMQMFFHSATHQLSQSEICHALWPKKDDPSETLYALIKRLKATIESNSNLSIEVDRGRAYRLVDKASFC